MSLRPFYYSMVLDGHPFHPYQAQTLLFCLEHFGRVARDRVVVQCTGRVPATVRHILVQKEYTVTDITPYLDGAYCNKITQLDYFIDTLPSAERTDGSGIFLLDLDLAVLSPLDVPDPKVAWGKVVDDTHPPLPTLGRLFSAADVKPPGAVPCDWDEGATFTTNFNGGFLYVPLAFVARLRTSWRRWAEFLFTRPELFDEPAQRKHIDQISFAMALVSEGIPRRHLTANWNFPCHSNQRPRTYEAESPIHVLHYHDCLDPYGLVAPIFSDQAVEGAAEHVNAALGERNAPIFFDLYKQHRARQAGDGIPSIHTPMFSKDFLARTRLDGKPRRLILHAGTPKTGTTSLQWHLDRQRVALAEEGVWYPPSSNQQGKEPKHQRLVSVLMSADEAAFIEYIEEVLRDMPAAAHTMILSTEGIYNHWRDYPPRVKSLLRHLAGLFDFEMCVWFREPVAFATSLYIQYLTNPRMQGPQANVYGRDIDFEETLQNDWFRGHLDFLGFYYETRNLFGQERVTPFLYSGDTIETFLAHYAVSHERAVRMLEAVRRENAGLSAAGVRLMRWVNRWRGRLPQPRQERVETWVRRIDGVIGRLSPAFRLTKRQAGLVNRYAGRGWAVLQEECRKSAASRQASR